MCADGDWLSDMQFVLELEGVWEGAIVKVVGTTGESRDSFANEVDGDWDGWSSGDVVRAGWVWLRAGMVGRVDRTVVGSRDAGIGGGAIGVGAGVGVGVGVGVSVVGVGVRGLRLWLLGPRDVLLLLLLLRFAGVGLRAGVGAGAGST